MQIGRVVARQILDSRGNPTVEVEAWSTAGSVVARVPAGASTGVYEAKELRDGGKRWRGLGVSAAVRAINGPLARVATKQVYDSLQAFDAALCKADGSHDKGRFGANALLALSMAYVRLAALEKKQPVWQYIAQTTGSKPCLPTIFANVINGGKHAGTNLRMQEFMIVSRAKDYNDQIEEITRTYAALKSVIAKRYGAQATGVGDEGGFAPPLASAEEALELLVAARSAAKSSVVFAIDAASSEFYDAKRKAYTLGEKDVRDANSLRALYAGLIKKYGIVSVEDPFEQHSFADFASLRADISAGGMRCQIVGDDLTVSNPVRVREAIERHSADCLLLKVNQIGTVSEAIAAAQLAQKAGWSVMVSHRSGETDDAFIAHLACGLGTGQIKIGAPCRGERVAKYNELIRIAESLRAYSPAY